MDHRSERELACNRNYLRSLSAVVLPRAGPLYGRPAPSMCTVPQSSKALAFQENEVAPRTEPSYLILHILHLFIQLLVPRFLQLLVQLVLLISSQRHLCQHYV